MDSKVIHNNGMSPAWLDKNDKCGIAVLPSNMESAIVQKRNVKRCNRNVNSRKRLTKSHKKQFERYKLTTRFYEQGLLWGNMRILST